MLTILCVWKNIFNLCLLGFKYLKNKAVRKKIGYKKTLLFNVKLKKLFHPKIIVSYSCSQLVKC